MIMIIKILFHIYKPSNFIIMKKTSSLFIALLLINTIIGCSSSRSSANMIYQTEMKRSETNMPTSNDNKTKIIDRKIIYSAYLSLIVDNPDSTNVYIEKIAKKYKGYVNRIGTYQTIIRVKNDLLNKAINDISTLGKVRSKNIIGEDVTEDFFDYQIRLENAEKTRKRYLELLAKAENVETTLKVEKELERLNEKIDLLKGKINRINHLSKFSTITINLREKKKPGVLGYIGMAIYYSIKWLFVRN